MSNVKVLSHTVDVDIKMKNLCKKDGKIKRSRPEECWQMAK